MSSCFKKYIKENQKALKTLFIVKDPVKNPSKAYNQVQNGVELFVQKCQWELRDQCLNVITFLTSTHALHPEDREDAAPQLIQLEEQKEVEGKLCTVETDVFVQ